MMRTAEEVMESLDDHDDRLAALEHVVVALCKATNTPLHATLMSPRQDT